MTVPAFAKEAAEKAVSDYRQRAATALPARYETTIAIRPQDIAAARFNIVSEHIQHGVQSVVHEMIMRSGAIPALPDIVFTEGEDRTYYEGCIMLHVSARTTVQDDTDRRELTKALAMILGKFSIGYHPAEEALKVLQKHGHPGEIPDRMKPRSPHG